MPDMGEESVAVMLRMTESLMLSPAIDLMKYCLDAIGDTFGRVGGAATQTIKTGANKARDAVDNHGHVGQVTMKRLIADAEGAELVSIPIEAHDLQVVQKNLKHYGVTFAMMENPTTGALTAHFKAKSIDQVTAALKHIISAEVEITKEQTVDDDKPPHNPPPTVENETLAESKKEAEQSEEAQQPQWLEIGNQELCEIDNLVLTIDPDGMTSITLVEEQGSETELFAERCPIPSPVMAKSFVLTQSKRFQGKSVEQLKEAASKDASVMRPTKEVLKDAQERATKRNEELALSPKQKGLEKSEPVR